VVAKIRERLAVNKQGSHKFHMERFNLKNLREREELYQARDEILVSVIHKLITSIWNNEEMPDQWKESTIVPIHKTSDKTDCNNYRGILLLSTSYKMLSYILLSQ
jgi:hypothetical protein